MIVSRDHNITQTPSSASMENGLTGRITRMPHVIEEARRQISSTPEQPRTSQDGEISFCKRTEKQLSPQEIKGRYYLQCSLWDTYGKDLARLGIYEMPDLQMSLKQWMKLSSWKKYQHLQRLSEEAWDKGLEDYSCELKTLQYLMEQGGTIRLTPTQKALLKADDKLSSWWSRVTGR